jgi:mono/diheme cytochrome c family protein
MIVRLAPALLVAAISAVAAFAQPLPTASRGELLYNTHCIACHSREIHWREQKLATDWTSLVRQVQRWAGNTGLAWSDDEVGDVARYLNATIYRFATPSVTGATDGPATTPATTNASISASS